MCKRAFRLCALVVLSLCLLAAATSAQEVATIQATANVVTGLGLAGNNDLQFGDVTPGVDKTVDKTSLAYAGEFMITGDPLQSVTLTFDLPSALDHASVATSLSIVFTNTDASYEDGTGGGQEFPAGEFNPAAPDPIAIAADGTLQIWIGGTVMPNVAQIGGAYAADIMLTVALNN
jgi:hypothetical protein